MKVYCYIIVFKKLNVELMEIHFQTAKQHISIILWYTSTGKQSIPRLGTSECALSTRHCSMVTNSALVRDVILHPVCTGRLVLN